MTIETSAWMPMYWGDYFGDTTHLTTEQHGAYLLLIGTYWRRARPLPDDDKWLASVTKMTTKRWKKVRPIISEFFAISDGEWIHKRIIIEALKSSNRLSSARVAGRAGGLAKAYQRARVSQPHKKKESTLSGAKEKKRRTQISDDWTLNPKNRQWAEAYANVAGVEIDWGLEADQFVDHHKKVGTVFADWKAAWRTWVRKAIKMEKPHANQHRGNGQKRSAHAALLAAGARAAYPRPDPGTGEDNDPDGSGTGDADEADPGVPRLP